MVLNHSIWHQEPKSLGVFLELKGHFGCPITTRDFSLWGLYWGSPILGKYQVFEYLDPGEGRLLNDGSTNGSPGEEGFMGTRLA